MGSDQVFIFYLDRSGSMEGKKMKMAKDALKLFIQSLPRGAMFEVVSFGSTFEVSSRKNFRIGYANSDENVQKILSEIDLEYKADLGGTDILKPMQYGMNTNYPREKRMFLLTDGEVNNPDKVIQLAKENADSVKIHSFGIGSDCSRKLVSEVAKAGRGTASFVDETSNDLRGKVITALKIASEPSYKDCSFNIKDMIPILDSPSKGMVGEAFRNYPVNYFMIIKKS